MGTHVRHKAGGYIPPLAGLLHAGGWGVPPPAVVKDDVCHAAGAVHDVVYVHEEPSRPDLEVKQVTTLPWHFTPKGALFGPIYGIYVG